MSDKTVEESIEKLKRLLIEECRLEVLNHMLKPTNLRLQLRIPSAETGRWLKFQDDLEDVGQGLGFGVDNSKHYFNFGGERRWAWRLILQHPEGILEHLPKLVLDLKGLLVARMQRDPPQMVTEIPLHASPGRHSRATPVRSS